MVRLLFAVGVSLCFVIGLGAASGQDQKKPDDKKEEKKKEEKKKEEEILGKTIGEWITILRTHENPKFRRAALIALEYGNAASRIGLPAIFDALEKDKDAQVRLDAVSVLGRLDPKTVGVLKALVAALQTDKTDAVREAAATAIGSKFVGPAEEYVSVLAVALKDPHAGTRIAVAGALRNMGETARPAFPALFEAAKNDKEQTLVRVAAIHTLSRHAKDNPQTLTLLLDLAGNKDNAIREIAIDGLGRSGADKAEVMAALSKGLADPSVELRKASAAALGTLGVKAKAGWPTVKERLAFTEKPAAPVEPNSSVRNHLIRLTGIVANPQAEAVPVLIDVIKKDDSTENRLAAIEELAEMGMQAKSAVETLTRVASQDVRGAVREAAAKALKRISQ